MMTPEYRAAFVAECRWRWPELHPLPYPLPYDRERDPVCFVHPAALPSRQRELADRMVARAREARR